jgi:transaldolase
LKLFLDSIDLAEIRQAKDLGVLDGLITSPAAALSAKVSLVERLRDIRRITDLPISVELLSTQFRGMLQEAKTLSAGIGNLLIRLPTMKDGLRACKDLSARGIRVNMSLCFEAPQALLCAKAGAAMVSLNVNFAKQDDGLSIVQTIRRMYGNYGYGTEICVAGLGSAPQLVEVASAGADAAVIQMSIVDEMLSDPVTRLGVHKISPQKIQR